MNYEQKSAGPEPNVCTGKGAHANLDDARYCAICGSMTVYFQKGFLKPYYRVHHEYENGRESMTVQEFNQLGLHRK